MEEKERYELNDNDCIIDNEKNMAICDVCDVSESPELIVDLLNQQAQQIAELKAENKRLKKYETIYYLNQLQASNEDIDKFKQNQIQQSINIYDLLKENTKQVCEKIREFIQNKREEQKYEFSSYHKGKDFGYQEINDILDQLQSKDS